MSVKEVKRKLAQLNLERTKVKLQSIFLYVGSLEICD